MSFQDYVAELCEARGYTDDVRTLVLGLCEESGEVAAATLDHFCPDYKPKSARIQSNLEHELIDCLTYLCAIANAAHIRLPLEGDQAL